MTLEQLDELAALVAIPGVSAEGTDSPTLLTSAEACADLIRRSNKLDEVRVLRTDGAGPAVWAERRGAPGAPTVLLYAHHDVQPSGDLSGWDTDPWVMTERDGRLYGRGTADDKAGLLVHLAALDTVDTDFTVRILLEGDEEIGSPRIADLLSTYTDELRADVVIAPDAVNHGIGVPSLTVGLRGLMDVVLEVSTLAGPVHSGIFGGAVPDAVGVLLHLLARLSGPDGQARIPGLVCDDLSDTVHPDLASWRGQSGALAGLRLPGTATELLQRTAGSASVTVLGLDVPSIVASAAVLTPAAKARVLVRLAPSQSTAAAEHALRQHLAKQDTFGAHITCTVRFSAPGTRLHADGAVGAMALRALGEAFGQPAVAMAVGGSIPFTAAYRGAFGEVPMLVTALQDPATRAHGFNESLDAKAFSSAIRAEVLMLEGLAALDPAWATSP